MLRPYQQKAIQSIRDAYTAGVNRQLLCMATGTGKTECFAHLPEETKDILNGQMMVLLHRDELAQQAINKLRKRNPLLNIQQEAGTVHSDPSSADVIVASVQTLGRKNTERISKFNWENISRLVVDEAHRSVADSYYNVYNAGGYLREDSKRLLLGCTATPQRGDGEGLGKLYQRIVYAYPLRAAIEDGYLVDVKGIRVDTQTSLDGVSVTKGDYDQTELASTVDTPARNILVLKAYQTTCGSRQAIGFGVNIAHSQHLAETFKSKGIKADAVWGNDPDRVDKIEKFRQGKIQVLFNAQLLVEGFDLDTISCVILAAPTKSGVVFSQRVGRGTRLPEGVDNLNNIMIEANDAGNLKTDCIVLDVVDSSSRHSLVTLPTLLGLPKDLNLRGRSLVGSGKLIEEKLAQFSHLDFTTLKDIDKIEAFVQDVNLFDVKFLPEVETNSDFTWYPVYDGGYILHVPPDPDEDKTKTHFAPKQQITIKQNLLDIKVNATQWQQHSMQQTVWLENLSRHR